MTISASLSRRVRQGHRWVALTFVLIVLVIYGTMAIGAPPVWLFYLPLVPLLALMLTGLYLFVLPYWRKRGPL